MEDAIEQQLVSKGSEHYYMQLNNSDALFNQNWFFGLRWNDDKWQMNPTQGIDIVFYNRFQTEIEW